MTPASWGEILNIVAYLLITVAGGLTLYTMSRLNRLDERVTQQQLKMAEEYATNTALLRMDEMFSRKLDRLFVLTDEIRANMVRANMVNTEDRP